MDLGISGLASGFDWRAFIDQLGDVERAPQRRLRAEQSSLQQRNTALGNLQRALQALRTRVDALKDPNLFAARTVRSADPTVATATAGVGAALGSYHLEVTQLASGARQLGSLDAGRPLHHADVTAGSLETGPALANAHFAVAIVPGTITVNGRQISLESSDTLQAVFGKISDATEGAVSARYDAAEDRIVLSSTNPGEAIVLGSATDTSNFWQAARLFNNGTGAITSTAKLGSVKINASIGNANLSESLTDGGAGEGKFRINGVEIRFNASTDTLNHVLKRINDSAAGVTASYDSVSDRFILASKATGDLGIALEDVEGNFLTATKLISGELQRGKNLLYRINDGDELQSHSNLIQESSSGLAGLSIQAMKIGMTVLEVGSDTAKIRTAINDFLADYNRAQSLIETQTASTTDAKGKVSAGILARESDATDIADGLRRVAYAHIPALPGSLRHLESIGIASSGYDHSLKLEDGEKLEQALANRLGDLQALFADDTHGLAARLSGYLERIVGEGGSLVKKQELHTRQIGRMDTEIFDLERLVEASRQRWVSSFIAMETAQAKINQQMQFLQQRFINQPRQQQ
jgi:flagellar hook-associated protein 2